MSNSIKAAALVLTSLSVPVVAQDESTPNNPTEQQPSTEDRLKALGGQMLLELFARATTGKPKGSPKSEPAKVADTASEMADETIDDPLPETDVESDVELPVAPTEAEPTGEGGRPYLRSRKKAIPTVITLPR